MGHGATSSGGNISWMKTGSASGMKKEIMCSTLSQPRTGVNRKRWNSGQEHWAAMSNARFVEKGLNCRIDHCSYERQCVEQLPTVHEGPAIRQMEARGIRTDKGDFNRWVKATNALIGKLKKKITALLDWLKEAHEELNKS